MNTPSATPKAWLNKIIQYGYFPLIFFGINGIAINAITTAETPISLAVQFFTLMFITLVLSFSAERILPYNKEWNSSQGDVRRDIIHFVVNESMSLIPLLIIPIFIIAAPKPESHIWPSDWPIVMQVLMTLLIFDLATNLLHWLAHAWEPMWRLHAVHHEVKRMYGFNGIMKHPIYLIISSLVCITPLVILGMPGELSIVIAFMGFSQLLLQHSNTDYRLGIFKHIFAVAEVHRFHHLRGTAGNVNFSLFFSFYDHLFGHAHYEERKLQTHDIGLPYENYPQSWWEQMTVPLKTVETSTCIQELNKGPGRIIR